MIEASPHAPSSPMLCQTNGPSDHSGRASMAPGLLCSQLPGTSRASSIVDIVSSQSRSRLTAISCSTRLGWVRLQKVTISTSARTSSASNPNRVTSSPQEKSYRCSRSVVRPGSDSAARPMRTSPASGYGTRANASTFVSGSSPSNPLTIATP